MRRLICVALFLFANAGYTALVIHGAITPLAAVGYGLLALLWGAHLAGYRRDRRRAGIRR